jgi:hypothetical protein
MEKTLITIPTTAQPMLLQFGDQQTNMNKAVVRHYCAHVVLQKFGESVTNKNALLGWFQSLL